MMHHKLPLWYVVLAVMLVAVLGIGGLYAAANYGWVRWVLAVYGLFWVLAWGVVGVDNITRERYGRFLML